MWTQFCRDGEANVCNNKIELDAVTTREKKALFFSLNVMGSSNWYVDM